MTSSEAPALSPRGRVLLGLAFACIGALVVAAMVQTLAPVVARVQGLWLCDGDALVLVIRRRTSVGLCAGDPARVVPYPVVLCVSTLVWTVWLSPLGIALGWRMGLRPARPRTH